MTIRKIYEKNYEKEGYKFHNEIKKTQQKYKSLMSTVQIGFLMSIIEDNKFNNVLEIGTFNGVSGLNMVKSGLHANNNFNFYTIDINPDTDFIGQALINELTKEELEHCHINAGKTVFDIESIVPKNTIFDLIFIDGGHFHPTSLINLLFLIPYTTKDTIIVLHDVVGYLKTYCWGESFIFESWTYDKYRLYDEYSFSNMGCIQLHNNEEELYNNIKLIAKQPFSANPYQIDIYNKKDINLYYKNYGISISFDDINKLHNYLLKHYNNDFANEINIILTNNYKEYLEKYIYKIHECRLFDYFYENITSINDKLYHHNNAYKKIYNIIYLYEKLINKISWWIPVRKWRDNFRNKMLDQTRPDQTRPIIVICKEYIYI